MFTASTSAVAPSYREALDTSRPVSSQTIDWNSNNACRMPCESSGWYGVYAVENSDRPASAQTADGM